jgi:hypothetical protein
MRANEIIYRDTTHDKKQADFVLGKEVEKTAALGKKTIIISNVSDLDKIDQLRVETGTEHLYFYLTQQLEKSKSPDTTFLQFKKAVKHFLDKNILCTLDVPSDYADRLEDLSKSKYFIANIVIKINGADSLNDKASIKIQPDNFGNDRGVYVANINTVRNNKNLIKWDKYNLDQSIDINNKNKRKDK